MNNNIKNFYLQFGVFTNPGAYSGFLKSLPDEISELGNLVCHQVIHRTTLKNGNTGTNSDQKYGDMTKFPWYRLRCDDDVLLTTTAMVAELLRLDERGFITDRAVENKIVVTCCYVSVLMTAILRVKGIPARSRSGFSPYCSPEKSYDHWINQYWSEVENRWIAFDADGFFDFEFSQFDIPDNKFDWAAKTWIDIREGKTDGKRYIYADGNGTNGLKAVLRAIFYDFHALMNNEISYKFQPRSYSEFDRLEEIDLIEIDELAFLMKNPDKNIDKLIEIWERNRKFRVLNSPLIGDADHR